MFFLCTVVFFVGCASQSDIAVKSNQEVISVEKKVDNSLVKKESPSKSEAIDDKSRLLAHLKGCRDTIQRIHFEYVKTPIGFEMSDRMVTSNWDSFLPILNDLPRKNPEFGKKYGLVIIQNLSLILEAFRDGMPNVDEITTENVYEEQMRFENAEVKAWGVMVKAMDNLIAVVDSAIKDGSITQF
ncbi:MAG: hypothetical protein G01um101418_232 [Parcubacteria group bacterium Gr01-1014_18]|nr:MAG: hypothetical protein Greene041636_200 [Parcubacteria group bacterium Greene0416_36]TSC81392.1 MAG: hypothetical protein G01um101418_232 [Parcubacteria group bacterium Gr01-1014_18]TSC99422.1 MAG: hypothetical protein Greene101420_89 [Parcubacteria group bacterium Greene1014_20]TSD07659.1 MAG: hypothetical protein Greene07142_116 [Parcubacteria group bacterium Greene0714_2]